MFEGVKYTHNGRVKKNFWTRIYYYIFCNIFDQILKLRMWKRQQAFHHLGSFHKQKSNPNMKFHTCWIISPHGRLRVFITGGGGCHPAMNCKEIFTFKNLRGFPTARPIFFTDFFPTSYAGPKADSNIMHSSPSRPICQDFFCFFVSIFKRAKLATVGSLNSSGRWQVCF